MKFLHLLKNSHLLDVVKYSTRKFSANGSRKYYSTLQKYNLDLKIKGKSLNKYIASLQEEYQALSLDDFSSKGSRRAELKPAIQILEERQKLVASLVILEELLNGNDQELKKLAEEEKNDFESLLKQIDEQLIDVLTPPDKESGINALVLEIQAGVGGQEAMLFAKEIFDMYCNFSKYKGWELDIAEFITSDVGGIRSASVLVSGLSAFQHFRHEAGIHRVQRIPATEKSGRVHTSTVSVAVLPQPSEIDINIKQNDLKIETKRASGAGGQHVNKTESAVRITHLPTRIAVECQEDRSQIRNRKTAMARLLAILYQKELETQVADIKESKRSQVKTRNRNEKIRTYNFKDDRITDHRCGVNVYNLEGFFEGTQLLDNLIQQLDDYNRLQSLLNAVDSVE